MTMTFGYGDVQEEADLAVALFQVLREELLEAVRKQQLKKPVVVGVITPYREQVTCIQETLKYVLGPELAREVKFCPRDLTLPLRRAEGSVAWSLQNQ